MNPVSPDSDDLRPSPSETAHGEYAAEDTSVESDSTGSDLSGSDLSGSDLASSDSDSEAVVETDSDANEDANSVASTTPQVTFSGQLVGPLENLQRRYTDQLSQDIGQLEDEKTQLEQSIAALRSDYEQLQGDMRSLRDFSARTVSSPAPDASLATGPRLPGEPPASELLSTESPSTELPSTEPPADERVNEPIAPPTSSASDTLLNDAGHISIDLNDVTGSGAASSGAAEKATSKPEPLLPGESTAPEPPLPAAATRERALELPIPSTSEQQRQMSIQLRAPSDLMKVDMRKGITLSAIASVLMAWHYSLVGTLSQGGSWLGLPIGELGAGFVPSVALLWLRMLVMVPGLVLLAPHLYKQTWEDLQTWTYHRDRLTTLLIGSGVALFFSQVFIYQCIGTVGPVLGATLLFLYPLTAVPLGSAIAQERKLTPLGMLALVAIAMGGILAIRPFLGGMTTGGLAIADNPQTLWLGLLASMAFSIYIALTNLSYRQQCHPIPVGVVQFSTVAVLSSLVLLVKPLRLANISWAGFAMWGLLIGIAMLLVYLFTYSSLRMIGPRTAIVAAATPIVTALIAVGFVPRVSLEIIQWTGVLMVALGGIALGKEKLGIRP
ncbi:MAG: EamA family transporter [Cyanobacteria bacterium J06597_16]